MGSCVENVQESELGDVRPTSDGSESLQIDQKCDIMRVLSESTGTQFFTGLVILDFWKGEGYFLFFKKFEKKLGKDFKPSVQELKVTKSSFFHYH